MPFGLQVLTQNGYADTVSVKAAKLICREVRTIPGGTGSVAVTVPLSWGDITSGPVAMVDNIYSTGIMFSGGTNNVPFIATGPLPTTYTANLPRGGGTVTIEIWAIQV